MNLGVQGLKSIVRLRQINSLIPMIDIHSHILPAIDDGSSSVEESIDMARQAVADGIRTVVATPHTLNGVYYNPLDKVINHVANLREILQENRIELNLCSGSEVHICAGLAKKILTGEVATINNNGQYALVEFPVQAIPSGSKNELFQLKLKGITPIIAHPERNMVFQRRLEYLYDLVAMGSIVQITAMSITGGLGEEAMECAHRLLELRLAHIIATDSHSSENRPLVLSPAVEAAAEIMGDINEAKEMVTIRPGAILAGKPVNLPDPKRPRKKGWFSTIFSC